MCLDASVADHWDPTTGAGRVKYAVRSLVISGCPMRGASVFNRWNIAVCCGESKPRSAIWDVVAFCVKVCGGYKTAHRGVTSMTSLRAYWVVVNLWRVVGGSLKTCDRPSWAW